MTITAAMAIANIVAKEELNEDYIIPSVFNRKVVKAVADAVSEMAHKTRVARKR